MTTEEVLLQVPGSAAYISVVRHAVCGVAQRMCFTDEEIRDLKLAVGEACSNAVKHGLNDGVHPVRVRCRIAPECLQIEVRNRYDGVSPCGPIGCKPEPYNCVEGGLGVYLMKTLVDCVDFRWGKETAMVRLTKRRTVSWPAVAS